MKHAVISFPDGTKCYSGPNCLRHGSKPRLSSDFAQKTTTAQLAEMEILKNPFSNNTPTDIDETLVGIYEAYYEKAGLLAHIDRTLENIQKRINSSSEGSINRTRSEEAYAVNKVGRDKVNKEVKDILDEAVPYEAEFRRRGGWTRAFLVANLNGHVHKSRDCSTCTYSTRMGMLPSYSGSTEAKIVDDAGESACTVCYPSAPAETLSRPSRMVGDEARITREIKAKEKAVKLAKEIAEAISNPDGTPLKTEYYGVIKKTRQAEIQAVNTFSDIKAVRDGVYRVGNPNYLVQHESDYNNLISALANKNGITTQEQEELIKVKGLKKFKKEWPSN